MQRKDIFEGHANMFPKLAAVCCLLFFIAYEARSQPCTTLGQTPSTAFPVCASNAFSQTTVPYCGGNVIPGPCTDVLTDLNPFWYKFTCSASGTLGFVITPNDLDDDYDWQIFDITGHSPDDVFTHPSLFVACNWSGNTGRTGAAASGSSLINCAGPTYPTFSKMPVLEIGHNYILLISHFTTFTPSQNGYKLEVGGGTANIIDPVPPDLSMVTSSCDGKSLRVKLSKKMKCNSLATDGSDFVLSNSSANIVSASGNSCSTGFDMDSVVLVFDNSLPAGQHTLRMKSGIDANTLLDNCDREIPVDNSIDFEVFPIQPVLMDSLTKPACAPQTLELVFKKNILCSSVAADASDFDVSGPSPVTLSSVGGNCSGSSTSVIRLILSGPVVHAGTYRVKLLRGTDGNTLIDECGQEVPVGSELIFTVKDTVNSAFSFSVLQGCKADTVRLRHDGRNGVNKWEWTLDYGGNSGLQNADVIFKTFGSKQILLSVTNGFCSDSSSQTIHLGNELKAGFETSNLLCPEDPAIFLNKSIGNIVSYNWDLGNGNSSLSETPVPEHYPFSTSEKIYSVRLIVKNDIGCFDTATNNVKVLKSCYIAVPNAFTPNGDGLNDYLYPVNAFKADNLDFKIYNRIGQLVFHSTQWTNKWDGKINGEPQDSGIFVWMLTYTNRDTGKKISQKGSTALLR